MDKNVDELELLKPSSRFIEEIEHYRKEFNLPDNGIEGTSFLMAFDDINQWLENLKLLEKEDTLPNEKYVPAEQFILIRKSDNKIIGMSNLRIQLNEYLLNFGGNIGYSITPSERKKGYGRILLKKTLQKATDLGLNNILVTCRDTNLGSIKIIESNSGILKNKIYDEEEKVWMRRYQININ